MGVSEMIDSKGVIFDMKAKAFKLCRLSLP